MKRRDFCRSALAASITGALPINYTFANAVADLPSTIDVISSDGSAAILARTEIMELADSMRGRLLVPDSQGYDHARAVWNGMIDKRPALIAQCEGPTDVASAVSFARGNSLLVSVRGGGHSISGKSVCDGGLMIDMSNMNTVRVDAQAKVAWADGGCLEGHIDHEAAMFRLATTGGIVSHTGAAGLTLGGGYGRVCRKFGMACDNLIGVDIVTPEGEFLQVSADSHPDLLWALKGGGGNFGVVTALQYQLHEMSPTIIGGDINFAWKDARSVLRFYGEHGNNMPDELNLNIILITLPDSEPIVSVECVWCGDHGEADAALTGLRSVARPIADTVAPAQYTKFQTRLDNSNHHGIRVYMKSSLVEDFSEKLIDEIVESYKPGPTSATFFMQAGGAVARVAPDATAFPHRKAHSNMMRWHQWKDIETDEQRAERIAEVRADWQRLQPYTKGYYANLNEESQDKTNANYGMNYKRLVDIKTKYDPSNLLRLNANITPKA